MTTKGMSQKTYRGKRLAGKLLSKNSDGRGIPSNLGGKNSTLRTASSRLLANVRLCFAPPTIIRLPSGIRMEEGYHLWTDQKENPAGEIKCRPVYGEMNVFRVFEDSAAYTSWIITRLKETETHGSIMYGGVAWEATRVSANTDL